MKRILEDFKREKVSIHCTSKEQEKILFEELEKLGFNRMGSWPMRDYRCSHSYYEVQRPGSLEIYCNTSTRLKEVEFTSLRFDNESDWKPF